MPDILLRYAEAQAKFEYEYLNLLMEKAANSPSRAARISGLSRSTIWRMMVRRGLTLTRKLTDA